MKLSEKKGGDFTPHPESGGMIAAVLVDITPLKEVPDKFHPGEIKEVFRLVYETEMTDDEGKRFCIWSRPYTASLHEKASFRKDIKKILGRDMTAAELGEFDTESLIGRNVNMIIQHEEGQNGQTYAVISFLGANKEGKLKPSGKYTRVQDREDYQAKDAGESKATAAKDDAPWESVEVHVGKYKGKALGGLDEDAVRALIEKWIPVHEKNEKQTLDDKKMAAALREVGELLGIVPKEDF